MAPEKPGRPACFVAMPYGRNPEQVHHFAGWYEEVILPAVDSTGFDAVLASAEDKPNAINDEIRGHLAVDPMAVFDLGGISATEDPNPMSCTN